MFGVNRDAHTLKRGSMRTEPVKHSAGPLLDCCEPLRVILIVCESWSDEVGAAPHPAAAHA